LSTQDPTAAFQAERSRLQAIAYAMTGQVMDAEDLVQDAWLRWQAADHAAIANPAAWLTTVVSRLAIDRLRSAQHRRETYLGPWLPEPIVTGSLTGPPSSPDPADLVAQAEHLSVAFLTALERLNPVERAVLLLREVFDLDYTDIATVVDRSADNCRQITRRARDRVGDASRARRPPLERQQELTLALVSALGDGDLDRLRATLAADVTLWSDGGDRARAARHPIVGLERVARFLLGLRRQHQPGDRLGFVQVNGDPAIYLQRNGLPLAALVLQTGDDAITAIHAVVNPDKLTGLTALEAPFPLVVH
jgi:RNA polymerase sigma-70 factor (ECF subfamily)